VEWANKHSAHPLSVLLRFAASKVRLDTLSDKNLIGKDDGYADHYRGPNGSVSIETLLTAAICGPKRSDCTTDQHKARYDYAHEWAFCALRALYSHATDFQIGPNCPKYVRALLKYCKQHDIVASA
jgi:hypothetical protein